MTDTSESMVERVARGLWDLVSAAACAMMIFLLVAIIISALAIPVTGSKSDCEQANPGKVCGIVWLPVDAALQS